MAMNNEWLERHKAQTARLNALLLPVFAANGAAINKVMDSIEKPGAKLSARVKLLRARLKNRGDFGVYNAYAELADLYLALAESGRAEAAAKLKKPLEEIAVKMREYGVEYSAEGFATEKRAAKKAYGSEMIGIEHLWAKAVMEIFATLDI